MPPVAPTHVLIVDDEADIQPLFQQRFRHELRAQQIVLHFALSGRAALAYLGHHEGSQIRLILSDVNMPGMSGLELLRHLKAHDAALKVVIITAYGDAQTYQTAMASGADGYFTKPLDFDALKQRLHEV
jgi:two-component system chemotaxis response regulator CheY